MHALCFYAGISLIYHKALYALGLVALLLFFRPKLCYVFTILLAMLWALGHAWLVSSMHFPKSQVVPHVRLTGVVSSIPNHTAQSLQFEFKVTSLNGNPAKANIMLRCYRACPHVSLGEVWSVETKLRKPKNFGNPGSFDLVSLYKAKHIDWLGTVDAKHMTYIKSTRGFTTQRLRKTLLDKIDARPFTPETKDTIKALTLGLSGAIEADKWALFRRTGTTHLMVISGAHVGFLTGLIFGCVKWIWVRCRAWAVYMPAQRVAAGSALAIAFIYSLLSGFGIPAMRALIMSFFMLVRYLFPVKMSTWQAYRYALIGVLCFEPHSVLLSGFYLSFLAVAVLLVTSQVISARGLTKTLLLQLACLVALMPVTVAFYGYGSVNGFVANLLAIPWVGFIYIPLAFASFVLPLAAPLNMMTSTFFWFLQKVDILAAWNIQNGFLSIWHSISCLIVMFLAVIMPKKQFAPALTGIILLALSYTPKLPAWGDAEVDVLDVGQGLSAVVRTANHLLLYDTGPKSEGGFDLGERVVVPYLKSLHTKSIDMVVVSHTDLDHRGGLSAIEKSYAIRALVVENPQFYHRGDLCHGYPSWRWDGVDFSFLSLPDAKKKNNYSCVLKISSSHKSMLLAGDIEAIAERSLMQRYGEALKSTYMLVPHHGSRSSSSISFLNVVAPRAAVVSYGFDNRYHHPHPSTLKTYQTMGIPVYSTQECGIIRLKLNQKGNIIHPMCSMYHK